MWGNGNSTRDFCYIDDAAEALILAAKKYNKVDPINIGSGKEISIKKISNLIKEKIKFKGKIKWLRDMPSGPRRRYLKISKAKKELGFNPKISIKNGINKTIDWYINNHKNKK